MRIFVGNLARDVTEAELQQAFAEFGRVSAVAIPKDRETGEPRGFGFVEMPDEADAKRALSGLSGHVLKGRALRVDEARPRDERAPREGKTPLASYRHSSDGRGAERQSAPLLARSTERLSERNGEPMAERAAGGMDRGSMRQAPRHERNQRGEPWRDASDPWSPRIAPLGDDWSSPPRGVDDDGSSGRGNRNSRATGKREREEWDGDYRPARSGRTGGWGNRGRHKRDEDDEDDW